MKKLILIGSVFIGIVGCTEPCPHYNRLQTATFGVTGTKQPYGAVKLYKSTNDVGKAYESIGFMSCQGHPGEEGAILKAMLYRAADMGADGLLLGGEGIGEQQLHSDAQTFNVKVGWMALIGNNDCVYRANAIRFKP